MESRMEAYLNAAISGNTENLPKPISRIDFLLCELIKTLGKSGASIEEVEKIVTDKVAEIVADAPEDFDTLKELSDWIYTHEESAATMNTAIRTNANSIESLLTDVNKKANSDDVYDKATADSRFLGIDATADKAVADENGSNISETFSDVKNDIAINRTTLGTQCKNLLKNNAVTKTVSGVTFTINDDKSITVNGTATAQISFVINNKVGLGIGNYILTGCPSGGSWNTFYLTAYASSAWLTAPDFGSGCKIENKTVTQVVITIASGYTANNLKFYPMLRDADITDGTYEPYKENIDERLINNTFDIAISRITIGYQCKNLLKNNAVTQTINGVTFTVNSDGSVTVNGTNTSSSTGANLEICGFKNYGTGKLTASLNSTDSNLYMSVFDKSWIGIGFVCDEEITWDNGNKERLVRLVVKPEATINNVTVYPMIRYTNITDDTYKPYKENIDERLIKNKSDIAVNKSTLGYQCKNLLPFPKTISKDGITFTCDENGYMTASNTTSDVRQWAAYNSQYNVKLKPGKYILSFASASVCTNAYGNIKVLSANDKQIVDIGQTNYYDKTSGAVEFTIDTEQTVYIMSKIFDGKTAIMLRYADITDSNYEPYQPSLYEQIIALEARIAALEV